MCTYPTKLGRTSYNVLRVTAGDQDTQMIVPTGRYNPKTTTTQTLYVSIRAL